MSNGFSVSIESVCPCGSIEKHKATMMPKYKIGGKSWYFLFKCKSCGKEYYFWHSLFKYDDKPDRLSIYKDDVRSDDVTTDGMIMI